MIASCRNFRRGNTDLVGLVGHGCDLMPGNHYVPGTIEPVHALELQFRYEQVPREVKDAPWSWDAGIWTVRVPNFHICRFLEIENG